MFLSLELCSFQGVLLVEHIALELGEVRSIFAFDTPASELTEIYLVLGPKAFLKFYCESEQRVGSLSDFMSRPMFRAICLYLG